MPQEEREASTGRRAVALESQPDYKSTWYTKKELHRATPLASGELQERNQTSRWDNYLI